MAERRATHAVRIQLPASFDFDWMRGFLTLRRVPSLEAWTDDTYVRSVWVDAASAASAASRKPRNGMRADSRDAGQSVTLTIRHRVPRGGAGATPARAWLDVTWVPDLPREVVRALVTRMFDLDADLDAFAVCVRRDRVLGPLVRRRPYVRLPRLLDPFEGLVRAMLGQQVTVRAASTMTDRFVRRFGTLLTATPGDAFRDAAIAVRSRASGAAYRDSRASAAASHDSEHDAVAAVTSLDSGTTWADSSRDSARDAATAGDLFSFPRPDVIVRAGADGLRAIGLTRAKAAAIVAMADALATGRLDCARLATLASDEAHALLVSLPGIGPWTASYVRMRVLGDRDAFPAADLGVIKALEALGVPRAEHVAVAERWRPWRGYATVHLWESLSP